MDHYLVPTGAAKVENVPSLLAKEVASAPPVGCFFFYLSLFFKFIFYSKKHVSKVNLSVSLPISAGDIVALGRARPEFCL